MPAAVLGAWRLMPFLRKEPPEHQGLPEEAF